MNHLNNNLYCLLCYYSELLNVIKCTYLTSNEKNITLFYVEIKLQIKIYMKIISLRDLR